MTKKKKAKMGRPKVENPRVIRLTVRLLPEEYRRLERAADGKDLAGFIRSAIDAYIAKESRHAT